MLRKFYKVLSGKKSWITINKRPVFVNGPGRGSGGTGRGKAAVPQDKRDRLLEYSNGGNFDIASEVTGFHDGQLDGYFAAYDKGTGKIIGYVDYTVYQEEPHISYVEVNEDARGQGVGKRLLARLQSEHETPINFGMTTGEGELLRKSFEKLMKTI